MSEEITLRWLKEDVEDSSIGAVNSDSDAESEHDDLDLDAQIEKSDDEFNSENVVTTAPSKRNHSIYLGKDGFTEWYQDKPPPLKTARHAIVKQLPEVKDAAKDLKTILECWKIFFPSITIANIVKYTNQQLEERALAYSRNERDCPSTDFEEMSAFLGILYLAGVKKSQYLNTDELWATDGTAPDCFIACMSKRRFHTLLQAIRFDDKETRNQRKQCDNLAPIRQLLDEFLKACTVNYSPSAYCTIDEMLVPFRGKCKFRVHVPNKPANYGIKMYALCDARTFYTMNLEVYTGKQPTGPHNVSNDATSVIMRMIKPVENSWRNITVGNNFTSIPLANDLYTNHRLTLVGTLQKNAKEIPRQLLSDKGRRINSNLFAFGRKPTNNCLLISHVPKKGKNVLLLSTMHDDDSFDSGEANEPEAFTFYDLTKGAVDVVDQLKSEYSVSRVSSRWSLSIFFSLLNIGTINAQIIYKMTTGDLLPRRKFITQLSLMLMKPHLMRRLSVSNLPMHLREKIKYVAGVDVLPTHQTQTMPEERTKCVHCPRKKNRFTQRRCNHCARPICKEHTETTVYLCCGCSPTSFEERLDIND